MADKDFYRAFEDRYRGSRELIKSRQSIYLPFIQPLKEYFPKGQGIDLGCGRGEWLELMRENGIAMCGVDLDQGMLEEARQQGLEVMLEDAIQSLEQLPSESQMLVSGFHLVEHLPFETLQIMIKESLRVLSPGGLLILETPNPENITVGTEKFYLDPSHYRPIPSQFLSFMAEYVGFQKVKVLRLQEPLGLATENSLILLSVLNGVSPDYAVIAQKPGPLNISNATNLAFEPEYGLSLERLANNYDWQIKTSIQQVDAKTHYATHQAEQASHQAHQAALLAQQAIDRAHQAELALVALHNSSSWRITAPLRSISKLVKFIRKQTTSAKLAVRKRIMYVLLHALLYTNRRPRLSLITKLGFSLFPSIKCQIEQAGKVAGNPYGASYLPSKATDLSAQAYKIYNELKKAIGENQEERR